VSQLLIWTRVPKGASLEVEVHATSGKCVTNAEFVTQKPNDSQTTELWTDAELQPGPRPAKLHPPNEYATFVRVTFPGKTMSTADVTARIVKADGSTFGAEKTASVSGRKGDPPRLVTVIVQTLKS
jgi:hypothetical protein